MTEAQLANDHFARVAEAFSRKAKIYDAFGEDHVNLMRMRRRVYVHVHRFLRPGDRILELNAGTGTDAAYFASRGYSVHATDIAPGMLAALAAKIDAYGLQEKLTWESRSFTDLHDVSGRPYPYIFSNFGGLNCIRDLTEVTRHLPSVLATGGRLTWVIMPPFCPWELATVVKGSWRTATRRLHRNGILAHVEGVRFMTYYFTPKQVLKALGPDFRLERLEGLSVFTPPADRNDFARRFRRLYGFLVWLDDRLSIRPPFNGWGDFFILTARHEPS